MNCAEWETRVGLYAGGDLTGGEAADVERHLGECSACQAFRSDLRDTLAVLQSAHADLPAPGDFTAVRSRVMAELQHRALPWRRLAWISGVAVAAAAALLVALWPARVAPEAPRLLASIPPAPQVAKVSPPAAVRPVVRRVVTHLASAPRRAPLTIKWQTGDPNIVIYWIAD